MTAAQANPSRPAVSTPQASIDVPARPHAATAAGPEDARGSGLSPWKWLLLSALLWVLACGAALLALVADEPATEGTDRYFAFTYLFFAPSTLLTLAALAAFVIGSVRWAIAGAHGEGLKTAEAAGLRSLLASINERAAGERDRQGGSPTASRTSACSARRSRRTSRAKTSTRRWCCWGS